jgi:hypothetical protein
MRSGIRVEFRRLLMKTLWHISSGVLTYLIVSASYRCLVSTGTSFTVKSQGHKILTAKLKVAFSPLRMAVYFCHQNQNAKYIGNFTTLLKPHNNGTHLKGIKTSFQVVPLLFISFHFWASYITFSKYLQSLNLIFGISTSVYQG